MSSSADNGRRERLKAALRENLKRRKARAGDTRPAAAESTEAPDERRGKDAPGG